MFVQAISFGSCRRSAYITHRPRDLTPRNIFDDNSFLSPKIFLALADEEITYSGEQMVGCATQAGNILYRKRSSCALNIVLIISTYGCQRKLIMLIGLGNKHTSAILLFLEIYSETGTEEESNR